MRHSRAGAVLARAEERRWWYVSSLVVGLVVACAAAPFALAASPGRPPAWRVVSLPTSGSGPFSYAEPGIAVGPNGTLVVDAATANTGAPPTFWFSPNDGGSWGTGRDVDPTGAATGDADAAIGADGYLYALNLAFNPNPPAQPTNPTVLVYRSRDGITWSGPASFPPPHGIDQPDRPWLVVDPRDPSVVDMVNSEVGGNVVLWHSVDHGLTFAGPYPVTGGPNSQAGLALSSRPLFDPSAAGRLFMLYETAGVPGGPIELAGDPPVYEFPLTEIWLATSTDGGLNGVAARC